MLTSIVSGAHITITKLHFLPPFNFFVIVKFCGSYHDDIGKPVA